MEKGKFHIVGFIEPEDYDFGNEEERR